MLMPLVLPPQLLPLRSFVGAVVPSVGHSARLSAGSLLPHAAEIHHVPAALEELPPIDQVRSGPSQPCQGQGGLLRSVERLAALMVSW